MKFLVDSLVIYASGQWCLQSLQCRRHKLLSHCIMKLFNTSLPDISGDNFPYYIPVCCFSDAPFSATWCWTLRFLVRLVTMDLFPCSMRFLNKRHKQSNGRNRKASLKMPW